VGERIDVVIGHSRVQCESSPAFLSEPRFSSVNAIDLGIPVCDLHEMIN
jgi:hypothetical protein